MIECDLVVLENNATCMIIDEITIDENKYLILSNVIDEKDLYVRKEIGECLKGLNSEQELQIVLNKYLEKKYKNG